jgi:fructosamine-3-kinase
MNRNDLHRSLKDILGVPVTGLTPLRGGSISAAFQATLSDGQCIFVKTSPLSPDMFTAEAHGLQALRSADAIRIPNVLHADEHLLLLEYLPNGPASNRKEFFELFGTQCARLHRRTDASFGFDEDNYIGSTPQKNTARSASWAEFFMTQRMEFQFRLAEQNRLVDSTLRSAFRTLEKNILRIIPYDGEPPALLHGDLWSGNYLILENNVPAIIDPAAYYGHREADIAMTLLFGGFDSVFYRSYHEEYPLADGWEERVEVYKLYHLFNHLNLFGTGYYQQVLETILKVL